MKLTTEITKVKDWVFDGLATRRSVKLVAGLVLGAVMLSGTAVYFGPDHFPGKLGPIPGNISSNELSGNTFRIREEQRAADRQDDLRDMVRYWNQLERDAEVDATVKSNDMDAFRVVSVNESSGETLRMREQQRQADHQEDFQFMVHYWNQLERGAEVNTTVKSYDVDAFSVVPVNESSGETFRIREVQRATDRADDLRDMVQYWSQLKQSPVDGAALNKSDKETGR